MNRITFVKPKVALVKGYKISKDRIAVAINPLYKAPIIFLLFPNLQTKSLIDVIIHDPQLLQINHHIWCFRKKIDARTMPATIVTA